VEKKTRKIRNPQLLDKTLNNNKRFFIMITDVISKLKVLFTH